MPTTRTRSLVAIGLCVIGVALAAGSLGVVHLKYTNNGYRGDGVGTFSATLWHVCIKVGVVAVWGGALALGRGHSRRPFPWGWGLPGTQPPLRC